MGSPHDIVIPDWVALTDPSGQMRPSTGAAYQRRSRPQELQAQTIAEDEVIPIIYGGPERIAGMPYTTCLASNGNDLLVSFIICEGEVQGFANIEVNNAAPPAGCTFTGYYGTPTQGIDPDLAAAIPGFNESFTNAAYIVARFAPGAVSGMPNVTVEVMGRKIVDRGSKGVTLAQTNANFITVANSVQNRANGATVLELKFVGALNSWAVAATTRSIISKYKAGAGNSSLILHITVDGNFDFYVSSDGTNFTLVARCPTAIPLAPGQFGGVRVVANLASGGNRTAQFYYSTDGVVWIALGALVSSVGVTSMFDAGTVPWQIAGRAQNTEAIESTAAGTIYSASVIVAGVERVRFNPEDAAVNATTWLAPTGEAWTISGGANVQQRAAFASTNPAVILDDFMRTFAKRAVNLASVRSAAAFCDAAVVGVEKRATLTITLKEARDCDEWIEVLRGYIPAWVVYKDAEWHIIPDAASAAVLDYNADTDNRTDGASPMQLFKRGARDVPNIVEVSYTETSIKPWTTKRAIATLPGIGTGQKRKTSLAFPGIRDYSQAYRFAVERLNHYTLEAIEGEVSVMDDGVQMVPGDIITITDAAHGWAAKPVRVLRVDETDSGRWKARFREFFAGAYANDVPASPLPPNSGTLPNPINVAAVTGLAASESLKFEQGVDTAGTALSRGLIWQSRIEASWNATADSFFDFYEIALTGSTLTQPAVSTSKLAKFSSATLIQGTTYQLQVRIVNTLGFAGAWATVAVDLKGKVTPPSDVTIVDMATEIGGEVLLRWRAIPDIDVMRYEWRAFATSAASMAWDSMTLVDRPDTTYARFKGLAPGATLFAVKAIDSVGRYSANPFFVNVTITSDASAFLQTFDFVIQANAGVTREDNVRIVEGDTSRPMPRWLTKGIQFWDTAGVMPNPVASGIVAGKSVAGYGRNGNWATPCQAWDFGLALEAVVKVNLSWWRVLNDTATVYVAYSLDGSTYSYDKSVTLTVGQPPPGWVNFAITARYVRLEFYSNNPPAVMMQEGFINAQVSSSTRKESGSATSSASTFTRVNLASKYTKAVSITVTAQGSTFGSPSYANVIVGLSTTPNSFDVYMFNAAGAQIAIPFSWKFEGV